MIDIADWSTTPGSNTDVDGTDIDEGCDPGTINNAIRAVMANIAAIRDLIGGAKVSAGTADAQTLTTGLSLSAYQQGIPIGFEAGAGLTNTGAMTMNVDTIGAKSVKMPDGTDPPAGAVTAGGIYLLAYESGADVLILLTPATLGGLSNLVDDTTPQLGGDLDLNGNALDFPTTPNIADVLDEDNMASDSAVALATQQSIKRYFDARVTAHVVTAYGAIGDGVADDTSSVASAVSAANTDGEEVRWPSGTYKTTSSISNFHDVVNLGTGRITRGSDTFYISPDVAEVNKLYVDTATGNDSNDGLSSSQPLATPQKAADILNVWAQKFGGMLPGKWQIHLAAGTHDDAIVFDSELRSAFPVDVIGASVANGSRPATNSGSVISPTAGNEADYGVDIPRSLWVRLYDISIDGFSSGRAIHSGGRCAHENVWSNGCLDGIVNTQGGLISGTYGEFVGTGTSAGGYGFRGIFNSIQAYSPGSTAAAPVFKTYQYGMALQEGANGHVDFITLDGNDVGLWIERSAGAANTKQMTISNNTVGVIAETQWLNNTIAFSGNTRDVDVRGSAPEYDFRVTDYRWLTTRQYETTFIATHTGTAVETDWFTSPPIRDWMVSEGIDELYFWAYCQCSLSGSMSIRAYMDEDSGSTEDFLQGIGIGASVTAFILEVWVVFTGTSSQRAIVRATNAADGTQIGFQHGASTQDFNGDSGKFRITAELNASGDTFDGMMVRYSTTLGG